MKRLIITVLALLPTFTMATVVPVCTAEEGLASLSGASCRVEVLDISAPLDKWMVYFYAEENQSEYYSGSDFGIAHFDKENPDGNGIYLGKESEPACSKEGSCAIYTGRIKNWRWKNSTYFAVEIQLKNGKPQSAIAHSLETYGGGVIY